MKTLIMLVLSFTLLSGCQDENDSTALEGVWLWKSTCGGFVGCLYADEQVSGRLIITQEKLTMGFNNTVSVSGSYRIIDSAMEGESRVYYIEVVGTGEFEVRVNGRQLSISQAPPIVSTFVRF